jgi:hypothetical protein
VQAWHKLVLVYYMHNFTDPCCKLNGRDFGHGVNAKMDEMLDYRHGGRSTSSAITSLFLLSGALVFVTWLVKKRNLQLTGQHKKNEVEFRAFPPSRGRVKYRDS